MVPGAVSQESRSFDFGAVSYQLTVEPEFRGDGYDRDDWPHWRSVPGSCFTVRDKALAEESWAPIETVPGSAGRCRVVSGLWRDPYTGREFDDAADVDVDHVVPLAEAYESGGYRWTRERRSAFANELGNEDHLMIVYDRENQVAKGKDDPADYLPPNKDFACAYLEAWLGIKSRWGLSVDPREAAAIDAAMERFFCASEFLTPDADP